jgi:hypothetical protein
MQTGKLGLKLLSALKHSETVNSAGPIPYYYLNWGDFCKYLGNGEAVWQNLIMYSMRLADFNKSGRKKAITGICHCKSGKTVVILCCETHRPIVHIAHGVPGISAHVEIIGC